MLGSGALVVMAEGTDLLAAATNVPRFFRDESCGKCVPCRVGSDEGVYPPRGGAAPPAGAGRGPPGGAARPRDGAAQDLDLRPRPGGPGPGRQRPRRRPRRCGGPRPAAERGPSAMPGHEFFTALTVAEALHGFRPWRHGGRERGPRDALHRAPSQDHVAASRAAGLRPVHRRRVRGAGGRHVRRVGRAAGLPRTSTGRSRWAGPGRSRSGRARPRPSRPGEPSPPAPTPSRWSSTRRRRSPARSRPCTRRTR